MGCSSSMFEAKGSKAVTGGWIYASRPCSQVELLQCGCSRKLVWISQSVKYFGDSMSALKVDKSPRQVDVSVQWSREFNHQLTVPWFWRLYNDSLCKHTEGSLGITRYCRATFRKFSEAAGIKGTSSYPGCVHWGKVELQPLSLVAS